MKRFACTLILSCLALLLTACAQQVAPAQPTNTTLPTAVVQPADTAQPAPVAEYRKITADQAHTKMTDGQPFTLLDVRAQEEFDEKHIDGAVLIPDSEIAARATTELPDKAATILVYCRSGRRSALAAKQLVDMGYTQVYDFGGINDWPFETVGGAQK